MHYDNLVFGATLESLFFSLHHGYPLLYVSPHPPPFYKNEELRTWDGVYFALSLSGMILFADHLRSFKFLSDNKFVALTDKKRHEITVETLFVFDPGIQGVPEHRSHVSDVEVLDYMRVRGFLTNAPPVLSGEDYNIYIYNSPRGSRPEIKDLCLSRVIQSPQSPKESELISRFFVEQKLRQYFKKDVVVESDHRVTLHSSPPLVFSSGKFSLLEYNRSAEWKATTSYTKFLLKELCD